MKRWWTIGVVALLVAAPATSAWASITKINPPPCSNLVVAYGTFSRVEHPLVPISGDTIHVPHPMDRYDEDIIITVETANPSCTDAGSYYSILVQDERDPLRYLSQSHSGNGERIEGRVGKGYVKFDFNLTEETDGTPCVHLEAHGTWKGYTGVVVDRIPDDGCFEMQAGADETVVSD